tara:strand:- start:71 stop:385 length:315 start_codon:yes stop_codon:yes gene_type:complete
MSDGDDNNDSFPDFSGKEDVVEDGFTMSEMIIGFGFLLIVAGFVFGLIRLMGLNGGEIPSDYNTHIEQLYLSYVIMFVGILLTSFVGFGGMFKRTVSSFVSSED